MSKYQYADEIYKELAYQRILDYARCNTDLKYYYSPFMLSQTLGLPEGWLIQEAKAGRLPCVRVKQKIMFSPKAVKNRLYGGPTIVMD